VADEEAPARDGPSAEEVFAERVGRLVELVERWRARIVFRSIFERKPMA
jgi:hypothetical protein